MSGGQNSLACSPLPPIIFATTKPPSVLRRDHCFVLFYLLTFPTHTYIRNPAIYVVYTHYRVGLLLAPFCETVKCLLHVPGHTEHEYFMTVTVRHERVEAMEEAFQLYRVYCMNLSSKLRSLRTDIICNNKMRIRNNRLFSPRCEGLLSEKKKNI